MSDTPVRLASVEQGEDRALDEVLALLRSNDLPTADVRANAESIYRAYSDGEFVGIGGVEIHGQNGLLRSVVVRESKRGRGYGVAICDALESRALSNGVDALYLLTTTASEFFTRRGYETVDRGAVPEAIGRTTEFSDLCPATATCMRKDLTEKD